MTALRQTGWRRLAALVAAVGILLVVVKLGPTCAGYCGIDVYPRYVGGELAAEGISPYQDHLVVDRERALGRPEALPVVDSPPVVGVFRILSELPVRAVGFLLFASSLLVALGLAVLLTPAASWYERTIAWAAIVVFSPVRHTLNLGQIDLLCFVPVAIAAARSRRGRTSAELAPLVLLKPQTTLLPSLTMGLVGLRQNPRRAILGAALTTAALVAFAAVVVPAVTWGDWLDQVRQRGTQAGDNAWLLALIAAVGAANGVVQLLRRRGRGSPGVDALVVAAAVNSLLAGMGGWNPQWHLGLVLPLGALLVATSTGEVVLPTFHRWLLAGIVAVSLGEGFTAMNTAGLWFIRGAFVSIALLAGIAWLLRWTPFWLAALLGGAALGVNALRLSVDQRQVIPLVVAAVLVHLVVANRVRVPTQGPRFAT